MFGLILLTRGVNETGTFLTLPYEHVVIMYVCFQANIGFCWTICSNPGRKGEGSQSRTIFVRGFNSSLGEDEVKFLSSTFFKPILHML